MKLYKKDTKGKLRVWYTEIEGDQYRVYSGLADGQLVASGWRQAKPKNVGKANATTGEEQAVLEVEALITKQLSQGGYHSSIEDVDNETYFEPMLAETYDATKLHTTYHGKALSQPKLDGIRCVITKDGAFSRAGKPIVTIPHILADLELFFDYNPVWVLDGELYNHDLKDDFNTIVSLVRKQKPTADDLYDSEMNVQYHIYDTFRREEPDLGYVERNQGTVLNTNFSWNYVIPVPTAELTSSDAIDAYNERYIAAGYEGQMIRLAGAAYENKRSKSLLKRKEFITEEFTIVDIHEGEGNWKGYAKFLSIRLKDGRISKSGVRGSQAYLKSVLDDKDTFIGGEATVRFPSYTPDGIPRFPVTIAIYPEMRDV